MIEIIPAIDLMDGKCVRLSQGNYDKKAVYAADPLDMALQFQDAGVRRLHLVDLDGAKAKQVVNWKVLEQIALKTNLSIDFGGGISTLKDCQIALDSGALIITLGSIAVKNMDLVKSWMAHYGNDIFWIGADVRAEKIAIHGWLENTNLSVVDFIRSYESNNFSRFFCTDISLDGMMQGPSLDLYKKIVDLFPNIQLTASGGIRSIQDLEILNDIGCVSAIIGKAIYEGHITVETIQSFNALYL